MKTNINKFFFLTLKLAHRSDKVPLCTKPRILIWNLNSLALKVSEIADEHGSIDSASGTDQEYIIILVTYFCSNTIYHFINNENIFRFYLKTISSKNIFNIILNTQKKEFTVILFWKTFRCYFWYKNIKFVKYSCNYDSDIQVLISTIFTWFV